MYDMYETLWFKLVFEIFWKKFYGKVHQNYVKILFLQLYYIRLLSKAPYWYCLNEIPVID